MNVKPWARLSITVFLLGFTHLKGIEIAVQKWYNRKKAESGGEV